MEPVETKSAPPPPIIDPALSLELRLQWLEALLIGVRQEGKGKEKVPELKHGENLLKLAEDVQRRLDIVVSSNEGLKRFMDTCKPSSNFISPMFKGHDKHFQTISMHIC